MRPLPALWLRCRTKQSDAAARAREMCCGTPQRRHAPGKNHLHGVASRAGPDVRDTAIRPALARAAGSAPRLGHSFLTCAIHQAQAASSPSKGETRRFNGLTIYCGDKLATNAPAGLLAQVFPSCVVQTRLISGAIAFDGDSACACVNRAGEKAVGPTGGAPCSAARAKTGPDACLERQDQHEATPCRWFSQGVSAAGVYVAAHFASAACPSLVGADGSQPDAAGRGAHSVATDYSEYSVRRTHSIGAN